jgi:hypothetical protein
MGCCETAGNKINVASLTEKIKEAIDTGSINRLNMIVNVFKKKLPSQTLGGAFVDQELFCINSIHLNALGYSLFLGKTAIFKFLCEKGASIRAMDVLLERSNLKAINVLCYKGHKELLEYYLPLYLKEFPQLDNPRKSFTIDLKDVDTNDGQQCDLAIHSACRAGMFHIVLFLYRYFKDKECVPKEFSIYSTDENFEEDAGLISCRAGCFALVKMLHETCGVDFKQMNNHKENAIMICVSGYKQQPSFSYFECVSYLIEVVGVDVTYMHEELLYIAEGHEMITYIEAQLAKKGVLTTKKELENQLPLVKIARDVFDNNSDGMFFNEEARRYIEDTNSIASGISVIEPHRALSDFSNSLI